MNSARRIIESGSSFWREVAPMLPNYVKHVNMGGYERADPPLRNDTNKSRHFLINELAFACTAGRFSASAAEAKAAYEELQSKWAKRLPSNEAISGPVSEAELREAHEMTNRLSYYVRMIDSGRPDFEKVIPGIGRLENLELDIVTPSTIFEVKAGERPFRSIDFRHLILALAASGTHYRTVALLNPREGTVWHEKAADFIETVCLKPIGDLIVDVRFHLSESGVSA